MHSKQKVKIHLIAAARPNFMKIAPLYHALKTEPWAETVIIHTGQHYDLNMSDVFFRDLGLPEPDLHLGVGSGSHAQQTGQVMMAYEEILSDTRPDLVVIVGDVNSTVACTMAAVKLPARRPYVGHLEAGLRSFDRTMPEEINRLVTDTLADVLWTPSLDGDENLIREGVSPEKINRVGNIMIDTLEMMRGSIQDQDAYTGLGLELENYGLVTLHRPSNVDDPEILETLCHTLARISRQIPLVFPIHPRTCKNIERLDLMAPLETEPNLKICEPLNYIRFMNLVFNCRFALTDSGGIQEETTYLGIPCLTLRPNTERPVTISQGTNRLCTPASIENDVAEILSENVGHENEIPLWDGHAASRVVASIKKVLCIDSIE